MVNGIDLRAYGSAIKRLWDGKCTVIIREPKTNEVNGRTEDEEKALYTDEPCRISFDTVDSAESSDGASRPVQSIKLFIDAKLDIPAGSKITVTRKGVTADYERSGKPAVYSCHQEISLELFRGWA